MPGPSRRGLSPSSSHPPARCLTSLTVIVFLLQIVTISPAPASGRHSLIEVEDVPTQVHEPQSGERAAHPDLAAERDSPAAMSATVSEAREDPAWRPLRTRGVHRVDISLTAPCRLAVTLGEFQEGRYRSEPIADAASPAPSGDIGFVPPGGTGASAEESAPASMGGVVASPHAKTGDPASPAAISVSVRGDVLQIAQPPHPTVGTRLRLELPSRIGLNLRADACDVTLRGDPVEIPVEPEPSAPRRPALPSTTARREGNAASSGADDPAIAPKAAPRVPRRNGGGDVGIFVHRGLLSVSDLTADLQVEKQEGPTDLSRIDGRVTIDNGSGDLRLSGVSGPVEITRAASVEGRGLRDAVKAAGVHQLSLRGLAGPLTAELSEVSAELEDLRGTVSLKLTASVATLRDTTGALLLHLTESDLSTVGYGGTVRIAAQGGDISLEKGDAAVWIEGTPGQIGVKGHTGPLIINTSGSPVRLRDVRGVVSVVTAGGNITADDIAGPVEMDAGDGQVILSSLSRDVNVAGDIVDARIQGELDGLTTQIYRASQSIRLTVPPDTYLFGIRAAGKVNSDFEWKPLSDTDLEALASRKSFRIGSQASGTEGPQPPSSGTPPQPGVPRWGFPPPPVPYAAGPKISLICGGDVEIRQR